MTPGDATVKMGTMQPVARLFPRPTHLCSGLVWSLAAPDGLGPPWAWSCAAVPSRAYDGDAQRIDATRDEASSILARFRLVACRDGGRSRGLGVQPAVSKWAPSHLATEVCRFKAPRAQDSGHSAAQDLTQARRTREAPTPAPAQHSTSTNKACGLEPVACPAWAASSSAHTLSAPAR